MQTAQREIRHLTADETPPPPFRRISGRPGPPAGYSGAVREWALLDTLLSSGLRASEIAGLRVGDCLLGCGQASLIVQNGKAGRPGRPSWPKT